MLAPIFGKKQDALTLSEAHENKEMVLDGPSRTSGSSKRSAAHLTESPAVDSPSKSQHKRAKTSLSSSSKLPEAAPLAERLRPKTLSDFVGQPHLTGRGALLMNLVSPDSPYSSGSIIFWGPPGCGKTTLARLLAHQTDAVFKELSATSNGINDVRQIFEEAKSLLSLTKRFALRCLERLYDTEVHL